MTDSMKLESHDNGTSLEMRSLDSDHFIVELRGPCLDATAEVSSYLSEGFGAFFQTLASEWRGWKGERSWASLEGDFRLRAKCDRTGHVVLDVDLDAGTPPVWTATASILLEAGHLDVLAAQAATFQREVITPTRPPQ
jgi:hypothetical protein